MTPALRRLARPALLLAGIVAAGLLFRLLPDGGAAALLHGHVAGRGWRDALWCVALGAALCAVGVPRQVIAYAAGMAFGAGPGLVVALAAQLAGCAADYTWARALAAGAAPAWAGRMRGRVARLNAALAERPFLATLALRLLPVGNNLLLNLAAGLARVPATSFLVASGVGYVPQTVVFALLGDGAQVGHGAQLAFGALLFVTSVLLGIAVLRRRSMTGGGNNDGTGGLELDPPPEAA